MFYKLYAIGKDFSKELDKNSVSAHAASAAFFIFLSFIPVLLLVCTIIPYTGITEAQLMYAAREVMPAAFEPIIMKSIIDLYDKSPAVLSLAAVFTVWSAAKGILSIMRALNAINQVEETRNYIVLRLRACVYTLIMLVVIIISLSIMVFGNVLIQFLNKDFKELYEVLNYIMSLRFLYVWIILALFFAVLYAWLPNKRMIFKAQLPGAVFTSVGWSVFSWGFSIYMEYFQSYNMYGSLTAIIIALLWLYICMYIMLLGAEINRYFRPALKYYYKKNLDRSGKPH